MSNDQELSERALRARAFVEKCTAEARAAGITTLVIGASVHQDGHDGWWTNAYGPCLSTRGLTAEVERLVIDLYTAQFYVSR